MVRRKRPSLAHLRNNNGPFCVSELVRAHMGRAAARVRQVGADGLLCTPDQPAKIESREVVVVVVW